MKFKERFEGLMQHHQRFHSEFQIDHFILGRSGLTLWGTLRQCLRELQTRYTALQQDYIEILKIKEEQQNNSSPAAAIELELKMENMERVIPERLKEFSYFFVRAEALYQSLDPPLTEDHLRNLEKHYWYVSLKHRSAIDVMCSGMVKPNTMEAVLSLPKAMRREMIQDLQDRDALISWVQEWGPPELGPEPELCDYDVLSHSVWSEIKNACHSKQLV